MMPRIVFIIVVGVCDVLAGCSSSGDTATNKCYAALTIPAGADCSKPGTGLILDASACAKVCKCDQTLRSFLESMGKQVAASGSTDSCVPTAQDATLTCENLIALEPGTSCRVCAVGTTKVSIQKSKAEIDCELSKPSPGSP